MTDRPTFENVNWLLAECERLRAAHKQVLASSFITQAWKIAQAALGEADDQPKEERDAG